MVTKTEVILQGLEDWTKWKDEFKSQAIDIDLWDYIKENPTPLLTEPIKPDPNKYKTNTSTPTTTSSTTIEPATQPAQPADLTSKESRNFQIAQNIYASDLKKYDA